MKKLILIFLFSIAYAGYSFAQVAISEPVPKFGCPSTTHDVIIGATNTSGQNLPNGFPYSITIAIYDNTPALLHSETQVFSDGILDNGTKYVTLSDVTFTTAMSCSTSITVSVAAAPPFVPTPINWQASGTYVVKLPPTLAISNSAGDLSVTGAPGVLESVYQVNYYKGGVFESLSTDGAFTPTTAGTFNYTAKAIEPNSGCLSASFSNSLSITPINKATLTANVSVYPNPITESFTIDTDATTALQYEITDTNGSVVKTGSMNTMTKVNVQELISGTYILTLSDSKNNKASYKLVK